MITFSVVVGFISVSFIGLILFKEKPKIEEMVKGEPVLIKIGEYHETWVPNIDLKGYHKVVVSKYYDFPSTVSLENILVNKASNNIFVVGTSGQGKSVLQMWIIDQFKDRKKIIFAYKQKDLYDNIGYPVLYLKDHIPNVFAKGAEEQFVQAFMLSYPVNSVGLMASQVRNLVKRARSNSHNWKEFREYCEKGSRNQTDGMVWNTILNYEEDIHVERMVEFELPEEVVVDFRGLGDKAFTFYGNFLLVKIHEDLQSMERQRTMIVIDEASSFAVAQEVTIPSIARLVRSVGSLLLGEQDLAKLSLEVRGNTATGFVGKQTAEEDLQKVRSMSPLYERALNTLEPYCFVDLGQHNSYDKLFIYKLSSNYQPNKPVVEWKPSEEVTEIDYRDEVLKSLESEAKNISQLGKAIATKYDREVDKTKFVLKDLLRDMEKEGVIEDQTVDGKPITRLYYLKGRNPSQIHDYLVEKTAEILRGRGIKFVITPNGDGDKVADIVSDSFVIEAETGTKQGNKLSLGKLKERVEMYKLEGKITYIITPNSDVKGVFREFENVFTLYEFGSVQV